MVIKKIMIAPFGLLSGLMVHAQEITNVQADLVIITEIHVANLKKRIELAEDAADKAEDIRKNARKEELKAERKLDDLEDLLKDI